MSDHRAAGWRRLRRELETIFGVNPLDEMVQETASSLDAARKVSGGRPGYLGFDREGLDDLICNVGEAEEDAYPCRACGVYTADFHPLPDKTVLCVPCWQGPKLLPPGDR